MQTIKLPDNATPTNNDQLTGHAAGGTSGRATTQMRDSLAEFLAVPNTCPVRDSCSSSRFIEKTAVMFVAILALVPHTTDPSACSPSLAVRLFHASFRDVQDHSEYQGSVRRRTTSILSSLSCATVAVVAGISNISDLSMVWSPLSSQNGWLRERSACAFQRRDRIFGHIAGHSGCVEFDTAATKACLLAKIAVNQISQAPVLITIFPHTSPPDPRSKSVFKPACCPSHVVEDGNENASHVMNHARTRIGLRLFLQNSSSSPFFTFSG
ncbi:uncharacterized protein BDZ83DRAFT_657046 [Colletotrichum acutatum]|uniref:Uncharacterized protein n=1 Tax=Glomerella acutata TaxID=27357 RepID=A0AAD8XA90_GLOAC|nr:uncharacterized protein BDZ83DRAFT_657046 [Colletotrichum acutatum]KAK1710592.1 hypothetical protein BDZ83DRAFT_657046 [Colletotrichum acutatum]